MQEPWKTLVRISWKVSALIGVILAIAYPVGRIQGWMGLSNEVGNDQWHLIKMVVGTPIALWILSEFTMTPRTLGEAWLWVLAAWFTPAILAGLLGYSWWVGFGVGALLAWNVDARFKKGEKREASPNSPCCQPGDGNPLGAQRIEVGGHR